MTRNHTLRLGARSVAAATLLSALALTGTALAAEPTNPPAQETMSAPSPQTGGATSKKDREEQRITDLRAKLKLAPEQDALWNDVAKIMRSNDERMDVLTKERHDKSATMTAVDDLRSYQKITEEHVVGLKAFIPAFEKLYDSMSAAQKANADDVFRHTGHKKQAPPKKTM